MAKFSGEMGLFKAKLSREICRVEEALYQMETEYSESTRSVGSVLLSWEGLVPKKSNDSAPRLIKKLLGQPDSADIHFFSLTSLTSRASNELYASSAAPQGPASDMNMTSGLVEQDEVAEVGAASSGGRAGGTQGDSLALPGGPVAVQFPMLKNFQFPTTYGYGHGMHADNAQEPSPGPMSESAAALLTSSNSSKQKRERSSSSSSSAAALPQSGLEDAKITRAAGLDAGITPTTSARQAPVSNQLLTSPATPTENSSSSSSSAVRDAALRRAKVESEADGEARDKRSNPKSRTTPTTHIREFSGGESAVPVGDRESHEDRHSVKREPQFDSGVESAAKFGWTERADSNVKTETSGLPRPDGGGHLVGTVVPGDTSSHHAGPLRPKRCASSAEQLAVRASEGTGEAVAGDTGEVFMDCRSGGGEVDGEATGGRSRRDSSTKGGPGGGSVGGVHGQQGHQALGDASTTSTSMSGGQTRGKGGGVGIMLRRSNDESRNGGDEGSDAMMSKSSRTEDNNEDALMDSRENAGLKDDEGRHEQGVVAAAASHVAGDYESGSLAGGEDLPPAKRRALVSARGTTQSISGDMNMFAEHAGAAQITEEVTGASETEPQTAGMTSGGVLGGGKVGHRASHRIANLRQQVHAAESGAASGDKSAPATTEADAAGSMAECAASECRSQVDGTWSDQQEEMASVAGSVAESRGLPSGSRRSSVPSNESHASAAEERTPAATARAAVSGTARRRTRHSGTSEMMAAAGAWADDAGGEMMLEERGSGSGPAVDAESSFGVASKEKEAVAGGRGQRGRKPSRSCAAAVNKEEVAAGPTAAVSGGIKKDVQHVGSVGRKSRRGALAAEEEEGPVADEAAADSRRSTREGGQPLLRRGRSEDLPSKAGTASGGHANSFAGASGSGRRDIRKRSSATTTATSKQNESLSGGGTGEVASHSEDETATCTVTSGGTTTTGKSKGGLTEKNSVAAASAAMGGEVSAAVGKRPVSEEVGDGRGGWTLRRGRKRAAGVNEDGDATTSGGTAGYDERTSGVAAGGDDGASGVAVGSRKGRLQNAAGKVRKREGSSELAAPSATGRRRKRG